MKHARLLPVAMLLGFTTLVAQNPPSIGTPLNDTLLVGSGKNFLLLPDVDDGDQGVDQEITFTLTSSDPTILEINEVVYHPGQTFAFAEVTEKGLIGSVTIQVDATDADGNASTSFAIYTGPYNNPGINFEIHDIVFWQQFVPLESNPAFSMIAPSGVAPYDQIDLPGLQLSVYSDCQTSPPCTGTDFFTALFKGYLVPPASGDYYFYMVAGDQCSIGLSSDESFGKAQVILHSSNGIGTNPASQEWKSVMVNLQAGKTYAIYGTQWNIHTLIGGILWEGPGIAKDYIPGEHMSYVYDVEKPSAPGDLSLVHTGITDLMVTWTASADNRNLAGYNIYANGRLANNGILTATSFNLTNLVPGAPYCMVVTSVDRAGNESSLSDLICTTTWQSDAIAPTAPAILEATVVADLAMVISWNGATDAETEVRGYNIYLDGILYNKTDLVYDETVLITGLKPETLYKIEIEAIDAGLNVSPKSDALLVTTLAFDPLDTRISNKKGRLTVVMEPIGRSDGLAVNPDYISGEFLNDPGQERVIRELEVAGIRWGALTANPLNFKDYIGTGKSMTFGRMMDFCNQIGAYTIICCGVEDATDWRTHPETFTQFLEYLAGPAGSTYGAMRAAEGYSTSLLEGSRGLIFEFGNEVWGGTAHDAQIGSDYSAYGSWCREMATLMKASPYYDEEKIFLVYSGRNPVPSDSYGLHESLLEGDTGEVDWLAVSGYLGGNLSYSPEIDPGKSELDYYRNGIAEMSRNLNGLRQTMDLILNASGNFKPTYMYEANMTSSNYFGRLGQAIVQTDYYASAVETGGAIPTVFHLTGGQWKMTIPSQDYKKLPLYYTTQFYNRFCKGNVLRTKLETEASVPNYPGSSTSLEPVGCHVYTQGDAFSVLLFSRDFENDFTIQVDLPDELQLLAPETGMKYVITGENYSDREAVVDSFQVTMSDSLLVTVPKHSMVLLTFGAGGSVIGNVPLGFFDYVSATSVEVYAYGSDVFDISGRQKRILLTRVEPENVLSDAVIWSVEANGVEVVAAKKSYGFEVIGSGTCEGNGTISVRASAWDNPQVYDEVEINISGQGTNCNVGTAAAGAGTLRVYPNPAGETLLLEGIPEGAGKLEVTDLSGRVCRTEECKGLTAILDLTGMEGGIYYLKILARDQVIIRPFVRQ